MREAEHALALDGDAAALALRADLGCRSGLATRAAALAAGGLGLDRDLGLDSAQRVLEGEVDLGLEVGATAGPLARLTAAEDVAEASEEVRDVAEVEVEVPAAAAAAGKSGAPVGRAEGVVLLALLGVREHVVGALDLLEALLGLLVARVRVRVVLARELAVGLLDLVLRRALRDAERVVERFRSRRHSAPSARRPPPSQAAARGRRGGSPSGAPRSRRPPRPRTAG